MLWKLGRIDGDPVLRETRIWATWEYVSSVGGESKYLDVAAIIAVLEPISGLPQDTKWGGGD